MLVECKECHKEISDSAPVCPHCGIAIKGKKDNGRTIFSILIFVFIIGFALFIYRSNNVEGCSKGDYVYFSLLDSSHKEGYITDIGLTYFTVKGQFDDYLVVQRSSVVLMEKSTRIH